MSSANSKCFPPYKWDAALELCYSIGTSGSWGESLGSCFNYWPMDNKRTVSLQSMVNVALQGLAEHKINELWLPVRRSSAYADWSYYSANIVGMNRLVVIFLKQIEYISQAFENKNEKLLLPGVWYVPLAEYVITDAWLPAYILYTHTPTYALV